MAVCGVQRPRSAALLPERSGGDDVGCNVWLGVIFQSEPFLRMHGTRAGQGYGLRHRLVHTSRNLPKRTIKTPQRGVPLEQRNILPGYWTDLPKAELSQLWRFKYHSAERRVGKESVRTCNSRWQQYT